MFEGKKSEDPNNEDYVPSKFHHNKSLTEKQQQQRSACKERVDKRRQLQSHDLEGLPANIQDLPGNIQGEYTFFIIYIYIYI